MSQIDRLISSWEDDTVDFGQDGSDLLGSTESVDGDNLCARHFNKLDIRSSDVGLKVIDVVLIAGLSEDTDDWGLFGVGLSECDCQDQRQD